MSPVAHINKVIKSINAPGDHICVDIVQGPNGMFGFAQFRRDPEDGRGWQPIGPEPDLRFVDFDEVLAAALTEVHWLSDALD